MTISTIWEPVLDAASDSGGNAGSRGRVGRRSSSIIAGRRPARRSGASSEPEEAADTAESSEEKRPRTPRRRRGTTATTSTEAPSESTEEKEKPAPRRRRSPRASKATDDEAAEAADASSDDEEEAAAATPRRRRRTRASADVAEQPVELVAEAAEEPEAEAAAEPEAIVETAAPARRRTSRRTAETNGTATDGDVNALRALVEEQSAVLNEVRAGLLTLGEQLDRSAQKLRLGVFVDVPNLMYGQEPDEKPVNMGKLLELLRQGRDIVRATAYSPVSDNPAEPLEQQKFVAPFVPYEYRIVTKPLKRFADGSIKGNFDVEMAIDMLTMADRLDVIAIVSGDADFARAVEVVQTRGVRVEVVAFARSSSLEMRSLADRYIELGAVIGQVV